ncbi:MAG: hypothetical protein AAFN30_21180, partial [Actinomycetota bacterium]
MTTKSLQQVTTARPAFSTVGGSTNQTAGPGSTMQPSTPTTTTPHPSRGSTAELAPGPAQIGGEGGDGSAVAGRGWAG